MAEREAAGLPREWEHYEPDDEERAAASAILKRIESKAGKHYQPAPHLLVYVNFSLDREPPITELQAYEIAERWGDAFPSCWLLWDNFIIRLWPRPAKIRERLQRLTP